MKILSDCHSSEVGNPVTYAFLGSRPFGLRSEPALSLPKGQALSGSDKE